MVEKSTQKVTPEFSTFEIDPLGVSLSLPLVVPLILYIITRVKFMFLEEGDISQYDFFTATIDSVKQKLEVVAGSSTPRRSEVIKEKEETPCYDTESNHSLFSSPNEDEAESEVESDGVQLEAQRCWNTEGGRWNAKLISGAGERKIKFGFLSNSQAHSR